MNYELAHLSILIIKIGIIATIICIFSISLIKEDFDKNKAIKMLFTIAIILLIFGVGGDIISLIPFPNSITCSNEDTNGVNTDSSNNISTSTDGTSLDGENSNISANAKTNQSNTSTLPKDKNGNATTSTSTDDTSLGGGNGSVAINAKTNQSATPQQATSTSKELSEAEARAIALSYVKKDWKAYNGNMDANLAGELDEKDCKKYYTYWFNYVVGNGIARGATIYVDIQTGSVSSDAR